MTRPMTATTIQNSEFEHAHQVAVPVGGHAQPVRHLVARR